MNRPRIGWGVLLLTLGIVLFLDRAGALDAARVIGRGWPVVLVALGLLQLLRRPRNVPGGLVLTAIGAVLLAWTTGTGLDLGLLLALGLVGLGGWLLVRRPPTPLTFAEDPTVVVFGDRSVTAPRGPLDDRRLITVFGDTRLDLRGATIDDEVTLAVTTVFGELDIEVPSGWRVVVAGPVVFGEVTTPSEVLTVTAPVLRLQHVTVFGEVTVRASAPVGAPDGV